jgi:hypothetical protein
MPAGRGQMHGAKSRRRWTGTDYLTGPRLRIKRSSPCPWSLARQARKHLALIDSDRATLEGAAPDRRAYELADGVPVQLGTAAAGSMNEVVSMIFRYSLVASWWFR